MPLCVLSQLPLNDTKSLLSQFDGKVKNLDIISLTVGTVKSSFNLILKEVLNGCYAELTEKMSLGF